MIGWLVITTCTSGTSVAVKLAGDGVGYARELLLLLFEIGGFGSGGVLLKPVGGFLDSLKKL